MKTTEQFKTLRYKSPKTKKSIVLEVGNKGTIRYEGRKLKPYVIKKSHGYQYVYANATFGSLLPVHRLVALAWCDGKTRMRRYVDHINSKRTDNRASNLRWVTRKMNNTMKHAKTKNIHNMNHCGQLLKATKGDQTMYFVNGRQAAKAIGCSRVLVYRAANPNDWSKTAKGWSFEWVPASSVEIKEKEG